MKRTATCAESSAARVGETVTLNGWVHDTRDHGAIHFFDLRDRAGITQVVVDGDAPEALKATAHDLHLEYCVAVEGVIRRRPEAMVNEEMATGEVEVVASAITVLSRCEPLPFMVDEASDASEALRLRYRYLDLRSFGMQRRIALRHRVVQAVRRYLSDRDFLEIETPTLIRSTPEGARDFLVPSRLSPGRFYALPQSPQLFKQLLMVSGFERYFQLAHCFRDEDARGDRQPEHTQIDIEMSFVSQEDVFELVEGMLARVFADTLQTAVETPFTRIPHDEALNRFGSDKPDLRFGLELDDFAGPARRSSFGVFTQTLEAGGAVKALVAKGCAGFSRKQIAALEEVARTYGAKGLAWTKVRGRGLDGGIAKFLQADAEAVLGTLGAEDGDLLLFVADVWKTACTALGAVRTRLGKDLDLTAGEGFRFCWITDFPLFERDEDTGGWAAAHHMFTMPQVAFLDRLEADPGAVRGQLYDLVCNGVELASGSIRIHDPALQKRVFDIVGFSEAEAERRFGFLLEAFRYGPPPHGGIAPGLDRLLAVMTGATSIREVMAFPKNSLGASPMDGSPSDVDPAQLEELHLRVVEAEAPDAGDQAARSP